MSPGRAQWAVRVIVTLVLVSTIAIVLRAGIVRGWTLRVLGVGERPLIILSDYIEGTSAVVFSSRRELIEALVEREEQLARVAQTAAQWEQAEQELADARALLAYQEEDRQGGVHAARVLMRFDEEGTSVLIDQGERHGIRAGQPVIVREGALFGIVERTYGTVAIVRALTHPESTVGATQLGAVETQGIVQGGAGALVQMRFIPQEVALETHGLIVTSGTDPHVPRGLRIGTINAFSEDTTVPFQRAFIEPIHSLQHVQLVGVLTQDL